MARVSPGFCADFQHDLASGKSERFVLDSKGKDADKVRCSCSYKRILNINCRQAAVWIVSPVSIDLTSHQDYFMAYSYSHPRLPSPKNPSPSHLPLHPAPPAFHLLVLIFQIIRNRLMNFSTHLSHAPYRVPALNYSFEI